MHASSDKALGERINDHMRYKPVNLPVEKTLNFFTGSTKPSKDDIAKFTLNAGGTMLHELLTKPQPLGSLHQPVKPEGQRVTHP